MIDDIRRLTDSYHNWLSENTTLQAIEDCVEITSPFLDRHNDHMQIYVEPSNDGFMLTDDGYTIADLEMGGCKLDTPKRRDLLNMTLSGFGVSRNNDELQVTATATNFARQKHNLLQAMLAVNDLFYLAQSFTASLFFEDVVAWLNLSNIRYFPNVKLTGRSGYDHHYDFVIPRSVAHPDRVLLSITEPSKSNVSKAVFAWTDTAIAREGESRAYALLNDSEKSVSRTVLDAFRNYDVRPVPWSERESVRDELAA